MAGLTPGSTGGGKDRNVRRKGVDFDDSKVEEISTKNERTESPVEHAARIFEQRWSFVFACLIALFAFGLLAALLFLCLSESDRVWTQSLLSAMIGGAIARAFGNRG